jgi:hypothetical protein
MNAPEQPAGVAYELALLQFRPALTSDEAINVGVMAVAEDAAFAEFLFSERYHRLTSAFPGIDGHAYRAMIRALRARAHAVCIELGTTAQRRLKFPGTAAEARTVFDAVLPPGSSAFRWSTRRFGVCDDLKDRVLEAFEEYVGQYEHPAARARIDDEALWQQVTAHKEVAQVIGKLDTDVQIVSGRYEYRFRAGWMNGRRQVVEPISLDYIEPRDMVEEALRWRGRLEELNAGERFLMTAIITDPLGSSAAHLAKYRDAVSLLQDCPGMRDVLPVSLAAKLAELVEADLNAH